MNEVQRDYSIEVVKVTKDIVKKYMKNGMTLEECCYYGSSAIEENALRVKRELETNKSKVFIAQNMNK